MASRNLSKQKRFNGFPYTPPNHKPVLLPTEIYLEIFSFAALAIVPQGLDISESFEDVGGEKQRDTVTRLLLDSIRIRAKISIVSKAFHSIMEHLLYEIIVITRFETIPRVLSLLRRAPPGCELPRGHNCRHLDINIPINLTKRSEYFDEAWDVGRHTLWGLLAACPHLEVLTARIIYIRSERGYPYDSPHLGHNALCKTISTYCARTLRRLELSGFCIPMDRIEMMLRYMSELETCSISDCRPFNDIHNQHRRVYHVAFCDPREYDQNEEEVVFGIIRTCEARKKKFRKRSRLIKSTLFSGRMVKEFYRDKDDAQWPPFHGGPAPYTLPKLHSFHLHQLNERIFEFNLPSLRLLSAGNIVHPFMLFNTAFVPEVTESDVSIAGSGLANERPSKYDIDPYYRHYDEGPHYTNPIPHSTPFGLFPSAITCLVLAHDTGMNLARILYFFPNLTNLTSIASIRDDPTPFWKPHEALQHITLKYCLWGTLWSPRTFKMIHRVLNAVKDGWLLNLSTLVLEFPPGTKLDDLPFQESKELGIELEVVDLWSTT